MKKITVTDDKLVAKIEAEIREIEDRVRVDQNIIKAHKEALRDRLVALEKESGRKFCGSDWVLTRSADRKVRTVSIAALRRYVTEEIINRCTSTKTCKAPILRRRK